MAGQGNGVPRGREGGTGPSLATSMGNGISGHCLTAPSRSLAYLLPFLRIPTAFQTGAPPDHLAIALDSLPGLGHTHVREDVVTCEAVIDGKGEQGFVICKVPVHCLGRDDINVGDG